jgi:hypothetical protein
VGYEGLLEMRRLHVELDIAVRDAYGWQVLDLEHDFHEVETLPENDRRRGHSGRALAAKIVDDRARSGGHSIVSGSGPPASSPSAS